MSRRDDRFLTSTLPGRVLAEMPTPSDSCRDARGDHAVGRPQPHLWRPRGFKTSCNPAKPWLNFHKWATCYPRLPHCTKRTHRLQDWGGRTSPGLPPARARHSPTRGSGRGAASSSGGREPWPRAGPREAVPVRGEGRGGEETGDP